MCFHDTNKVFVGVLLLLLLLFCLFNGLFFFFALVFTSGSNVFFFLSATVRPSATEVNLLFHWGFTFP